MEVKRSKEMEVEYMTLLQRDRENVELGRAEGEIEGENKLASLVEQLMAANRIIDMNKALKNKSFRDQLYEEYGI
jgi:hypothetical protein